MCPHKSTFYKASIFLSAALTLIKQIMESDIKEAKKHLNMSKDFPFISHASPLKDLKVLKKIGVNGGMPPIQYILGHWSARLNSSVKEKII